MSNLNSSFGFEAPEDSPGFLLWQTTITWQREIKKALDPFEITHPQFVILAILLWFEESEVIPNQVLIINQSKLDKMTVSKSIKSLALKELVTRDEHPEDTRAKSVGLTKSGTKLAKKLVGIVEGVDAEYFGILNKQDQKNLIQALRQLNQTTL